MTKKATEDLDPRLVAVTEGIQKILAEHGVGGAVAVVSDSHAQFVIQFPSWSLVRFEGENLRMEARVSEPDLTNKSAHLLFSMRDMLQMQSVEITKASDAFLAALREKSASISHE